jgi:hypothetical protein
VHVLKPPSESSVQGIKTFLDIGLEQLKQFIVIETKQREIEAVGLQVAQLDWEQVVIPIG